jgi:MHS family proline/betaine transporter-like MFS transporter
MTLSSPPDRATLRRAIIASVIGNGLEWFDFLVYGFFAQVISGVFFPANNADLSLILTFATFGVGFLVRPLGGILIGLYADRAGRQKALSLLILLMAAGTLLLGLAPSYARSGLMGPLLVLLARILQGISVGGEFASATSLLVEYAPPGRFFYYGSFQMCAQAFAVALASGMAYLLTRFLDPASLAAYGWRIPFLLGALIGPVGFYIRRRVGEAPAFLEARKKAPPPRVPLLVVFRDFPAPLVAAIGTIVCGTAATYLWNSYLPVYVVRTLSLPITAPLLGAALCGAFNMVWNPVTGLLCDRFGPYRVFFPALIANGLLAFPLFAFVIQAPSPGRLFLVQWAGTILLGLQASPIPALIASYFPIPVRSTALAVAYNVSVTLFGGLAPLTMTYAMMTLKTPYVPALYLSAAAALSLVLVAGFRPRPELVSAEPALSGE